MQSTILEASPSRADPGYICGYASVWPNEPHKGYIIRPGAFGDFIREARQSGRNIPLLFGHNDKNACCFIGSVVELKEDDTGLYFEAVVDNTIWAQQARELAKSRRVTRLSIGFQATDCGKVTLPDGSTEENVWAANLREISLVLYAADPRTYITRIT